MSRSRSEEMTAASGLRDAEWLKGRGRREGWDVFGELSENPWLTEHLSHFVLHYQ